MIDVIYLVKDKNRCHVYEPPQGLEISGPEARPPATAVRTQSIGVRARSQWAWHLARKLLPLEGHARAGRPGLRCGRPAPGDRRERSAAAVPLVAALRIPTVRSNSAFLRLSSRISRAVSVGPRRLVGTVPSSFPAKEMCTKPGMVHSGSAEKGGVSPPGGRPWATGWAVTRRGLTAPMQGL